MTEVFTHVISTKSVTGGATELEATTCPREFLGLVCMEPAYSCLCGLVEGSGAETTTSVDGVVEHVTLTLSLTPGEGEPLAVMQAIDMTGYKADYRVSHNEVAASFNLRRPQNHVLRAFIRDEDI